MFTNKGKGPEPMAAALPEPTGQTRRTPPSRLMTSIIANGVKITGTIEADGAELQVDGEISGNVRGGSVTIGDTGLVKGDIVAESVLVNGRIEGSLRARKVQLARNAHVLGDITHQSLSVEMGAVFEGQCRYLQDPLKNGDAGAPVSAAPQIGGPTPPPAPTPPSGSQQETQTEGGGRLITGVIVTGAAS
jgi:cytoskeletal protein CcmA (bactofilin family)